MLSSQLKNEEIQITIQGESRSAGLRILTAVYFKDLYSTSKSNFVLNHALLPIFNLYAQQECNQELGKENILNFFCEEEGVLQLVVRNCSSLFKRGRTYLLFSVRNYPDFVNHIGQYTHLSLSQSWERIFSSKSNISFWHTINTQLYNLIKV